MLAYNAEKYLPASIESILNQSEPDFAFMLINNGSTDGTKEIVERYAKSDSRIHAVHRSGNFTNTEEGEKAELLLHETLFDPCYAEYFATLDADDTYDPHFLKQAYQAAKQHGADMVVCGTQMTLETDPSKQSLRIPPEMVLTRRQGLTSDLFIELYGSLRPMWGKLFAMHLAHAFFYEMPPIHMRNGVDTFRVLNMMLKSDVVATLPQKLHNYLIRRKSLYHGMLDPSRYGAGEVLFSMGCRVARQYDVDTPETTVFLHSVYYQHVMDLFKMALDSAHPIEERLGYILQAFDQEFFRKIYRIEAFKKGIDQVFSAALHKLFLPLSPFEQYSSMTDYALRYLKSFDESLSPGQRKALVYSVYFDPANRHKWGETSPVQQAYQAIEETAEPSEDYAGQINAVLNAIDGGELALARDIMAPLRRKMPLDRFVLYLDMALYSLNARHYEGILSAVYAELFWAQDDELYAAAQSILHQLKQNGEKP